MLVHACMGILNTKIKLITRACVLYVRTYPIGFGDLREVCLGFGFVGRMLIGMPFHYKRFVCFANVGKRCAFRDPEDAVKVGFWGIWVISHDHAREIRESCRGDGRRKRRRIGFEKNEVVLMFNQLWIRAGNQTLSVLIGFGWGLF